MKTLILTEIRDRIGAKGHAEMPMTHVTGICTDSRQIQAGDLFFALKGPNFDGHDFAAKAFELGAAGVVVERDAKLPVGVDITRMLQVENSVTALGKLAGAYRDDLQGTIIAVTGSNGKTTTKELINHILSKKFKGRRSVKSFNNHIGVPLTIFGAEPGDDFLVVEVGTNHPGEIDHLGSIVRPDIAAIINVGESHLEGFGSIERVAAEKSALAKYVKPGGAVIANGDREILLRLIGKPDAMMISYGLAENNDMRITKLESTQGMIHFTINNKFDFDLPVLGDHNALNCLAAIVVARRMGMEMNQIAEALRDFKLPAMRLEVTPIGPYTVLNDAYNANPASMRSALGVLSKYECTSRRVFCCGQMFELGEHSEQFHLDLAKQIGTAKVDVMVAVGAYSAAMVREAVAAGMKQSHCFGFDTADLAATEIGKIIHSGDVVLVKGSRAVQMEKVIQGIKELSAPDHHKQTAKA
jgi:UDP-N-acetylmuramoyl-tripeptide--D-alanyl-D-alanine ligase